MSSLTASIERLSAPRLTVPRVLAGLLALVLLSLLMRSTALYARYWIDEGISVGIASHPLREIPGLLRLDGSPPLYYLLLAGWQRVVGVGEARTHALSLLFALTTVPVGFWLGRALFSERAGWFVAVLSAVNPFLNYYAQETRMYALVVLLAMIVAAGFVLGFVRGRRGWRVAFALSGATLLYTHNWGIFLLGGTVAALVPLLRARRVAWRDALLAYGVIGVLYAPWVPSFLFQAAHTGAPWSERPSLADLPGDLASLAGGPGPAVAILLAGGSGLAAFLATRADGGRDAPRTPESSAALALLTMTLAAVVLAFLASQISPAWTTRYFAAIVGPFVLLVGTVLSRAGTLGLVTVALLTGMWLKPPTYRLNNKSDVHRVAHVIGTRVRPGDVVVSTHPEQVPVLHFYFPRGLRWADGMGWVADPTVVDWRDALDRYRAARPTPTADGLVRSLRRGQRLVLVQPIISTASWNGPWTELVRRRAGQWERVLDRDRRLKRVAALPRFRPGPVPRGVRVVLFRRR